MNPATAALRRVSALGKDGDALDLETFKSPKVLNFVFSHAISVTVNPRIFRVHLR